MLIHPPDGQRAGPGPVAGVALRYDRFGVLAVNNLDATQAPVLVLTHFTVAADDLLRFHLGRPNPVWPRLQPAIQVRLTLIGDYSFIPTYRPAGAGAPVEHGVPPSYYTALQFVWRATLVDDAQGKADILTATLADSQPEGGHAPVTVDGDPYARMLPGIRGARLQVLRVEAKFRYDDATPPEFGRRVSDHLDDRGHGLFPAAAAQQRRRLAAIGDWRSRLDTTR